MLITVVGAVRRWSDHEAAATRGWGVYVGTENGSVRAFDRRRCGAATCSPVWEASTGSSLITGGPIVANGNLVVGTDDGRLVVFRPD